MISEKDYCSKVCGAKCCTIRPENITCSFLTEEKLCKCYENRFGPGSIRQAVMGFVTTASGGIKPFICGRIREIIADGALPPDIVAQCCIAHPELLECTHLEKQLTRSSTLLSIT